MRLFALTCFIFSASRLFAQSAQPENLQPLIIIDTLMTYNESMIMNPSKFISISTINPEKAVLIYGPTAKFGVIKIMARPDIRYARLGAILDAFNIESKYRNLKVYIDKTPVKEPGRLLADLDEIKSVEINSEKRNGNESFPAGETLYINIITQATL